MGYPIFHSQYTAAQIEASIGKAPRVNSEGYWEVWNIANGAYESTGVGAGVTPPTVVTQVSQMTNHGYVYIYNGNETGYTPGYWYYWDGNAWTAGGAYQVAATDPTLSVAGAAADAKTVGDILRETTEATRNLWIWGDQTVTGQKSVFNAASGYSIPAGTYTLSAEIERDAAANCYMVFYHGSYAPSAQIEKKAIASGSRSSVTVTLPDSADIVIVYSGASPTSTHEAIWRKIQLEAGETATPYVPPVTAKDAIAREGLIAEQGEVSSLAGELTRLADVGELDVLYYLPGADGSASGLTFSRDRLRGETTINGTLNSGASYAFRNFYHSLTTLPYGIVLGETYYLYISKPDDRVSIQITYYDSNGASIDGTGLYYGKSKYFTIPDNTVGMNIRLFVDGADGMDRTYSDYKVSYKLSRSSTYRLVSGSIDFDTLTQNGIYVLLGDITHTNAPDGFRFGFVEISAINYSDRRSSASGKSDRWIILQKAYSTPLKGAVYAIRHKILNQAWSEWFYLRSNATPQPVYTKHNVDLFRYNNASYNYLVRASYDESNDAVYSIGIPSGVYNHVVSFGAVRLIPATTPMEDTVAAFGEAADYKRMGDEIPALEINGDFVGSNHGNPNYTQFSCTHNLTETAIGTVWTDLDENEYTLVVVETEYLIFGALDAQGQLVVRHPTELHRDGDTLTATNTKAYQLRRSAINKKYTIVNDAGDDISDEGGGNNVIVIEEYDINDQSRGLAYLQAHVGECTNESYYDDDQPYLLGHIINTFQFNRNSSITVYGSFIARTTLVCNRIFGAMSLNFSAGGLGPDNLYVPDSGNCANIKSYVGASDNFNVSLDPNSEVMHHRYYQLTDSGHANFIHLLDIGCYDDSERRLIATAAYNAASANKFYCNLTSAKTLNDGDVLSWGYGRGPYAYSSSQTVLCFFEYGNGWIVCMDWHQGFSGLVRLPTYMAGRRISVLQSTPSVTLEQDVVTNAGLEVSCAGYGYIVMRID